MKYVSVRVHCVRYMNPSSSYYLIPHKEPDISPLPILPPRIFANITYLILAICRGKILGLDDGKFLIYTSHQIWTLNNNRISIDLKVLQLAKKRKTSGGLMHI